MSIVKEFREFAIKGNVVEMAVGIIVGAAFGKIVSSLVSDVVMPPIGLLLGGVNFTGLKLTLKEGVNGVAAVTLNYGTFVQTVIDFLIIAWAVFMLVKFINTLKRDNANAAAEAPPPPTREEQLLSEIRDLLKSEK